MGRSVSSEGVSKESRSKVQQKIRIGMDAKRAFCNFRGLGNYSRLLVEGLLAWGGDGVDLALFTPQKSLPEYQNWPSGAVRTVQPKGLLALWPELWRGYGQVRDWKRMGLDIYHGLSHELPWRFGASSGKTKTLVTIHDLIFLRHPELYPTLDRQIYRKKVVHACAVADSVIAISEQTKSDLMEFLQVPENRITVLYQAVHPRYYKKEVQGQTSELKDPKIAGPYFLFVGAFEERKNILRLLRAFSLIHKRVDEKLVLVGRGGMQRALEEQIRLLGLEERVLIFSKVGSEELPRLYQLATGVVYPSLFEGFGLPIVEALMSETLVLTSKGSCFPEAGGPSAFYVDPLSEDELAQKMFEMAKLPSLDRALRLQMGLEHAQKFHWKSTTENLIGHYRRVLEAPKRKV